MRWGILLVLATSCTAEVKEATPDATGADANPDTMELSDPCPSDPGLLICLPFDAPVLASPCKNEGVATVEATLTNVTRATAGAGGAAQVAAASEILIPTSPMLTGILAFDIRVRFDQDVPAGGRIGLVDIDGGNPGMSLFIYPGTTTTHRIRCNLGAVDLYANTTLALGTFIDIACTCKDGNVAVSKDGVTLAELAGTPTCEPASATTAPIQVGQNSRFDAMLPPNEPLVGAIDRVRVWTTVPQ